MEASISRPVCSSHEGVRFDDIVEGEEEETKKKRARKTRWKESWGGGNGDMWCCDIGLATVDTSYGK